MASTGMFVKSCKCFITITTPKLILQRKGLINIQAFHLTSSRYNFEYKYQMSARNFSNYSWSLDVVCSGEGGTSNTLLLNAPDIGPGYLFNCGEMTQRCLLTNKLGYKFSLINNIFLTSMSYSNIGGMPGYLLSSRFHRDPEKPFNIHGHPNNENVFTLLHLFTAIRINKVLNTGIQISNECRIFFELSCSLDVVCSGEGGTSSTLLLNASDIGHNVWKNPELKNFKDKNISVEYVKLLSANQQGCNNGEEIYAVAYIVNLVPDKIPRSFLGTADLWVLDTM